MTWNQSTIIEDSNLQNIRTKSTTYNEYGSIYCIAAYNPQTDKQTKRTFYHSYSGSLNYIEDYDLQ
ncbi:DUF2963 domain-containing protein, partial [Candidatus Phytoplasma pruni]